MNRNFAWTAFAIIVYWLLWYALGTDFEGTNRSRNVVAIGGIMVSFLTFLRYLPKAWEKYHTGSSAGEWRMLMGIELFWLGFGSREVYLMGDRFGNWESDGNPLSGFFAFWILCAGLLCYSAASEPIPEAPHQNIYIIGAAAVVGGLVSVIVYRMMWG